MARHGIATTIQADSQPDSPFLWVRTLCPVTTPASSHPLARPSVAPDHAAAG